MRNHTATHLLQKALRTVLGAHVEQQGSLVAPDRLRFDFRQDRAMTADEIEHVTEMMNEAILSNHPVGATQQAYADAIASGAMALFSEKYGDTVRVVRVGGDDAPYSAELCGGTHVRATGEIGSAMILSEGAVGSGVRRIEVATGHGALEATHARARDLGAIAQTLGVGQDRAAEQAARLAQELGDTRKALERAQVALARARFDQVLAQETPLGGQSVLIARVETATSDTLREMTDWYRAARPEGVCVLGAVIGDKPQAVVSVPAALNKRGLDAGKVIRDIAGVMGGGGGGRPTFAQGSGKDAAKLDDALARARALVEAALKA